MEKVENKIVAITLMRKGSERFPNKVMYSLFGIPLYVYTVEYARRLGVPYYLAHDYDDIYLPEFVNEIKRKKTYIGNNHKTCKEIKSFKLDAEVYILLQATSPFREGVVIKVSAERLLKDDKLKVIIGGKVIKNRFTYKGKIATPANFKQKDRTDNGCDKQVMFQETGNFYIFKKCQLEKKHILDCKESEIDIMYDTPDIDIDTPKDVQEIERKIYEI